MLNCEQIVQSLAKQVRLMETAGRAVHGERCISSGIEALDRCLPDGGYAAGSLVELLRERSASGATFLALLTARQAMANGKYLVVVDRERRFYAPAMLSMGIAMDRVIVVHPESESELVWSIDQSLRSSGVGAVLAEIGRLDDRGARRLQLAAERGGGIGLLIRQSKMGLGMPSWADVQWCVRPRAHVEPESSETPQQNLSQQKSSQPKPAPFHTNRRSIDLHLMRCRGGRAGARLSLILDGEVGGGLRVLEDRTIDFRSQDTRRTEGVRHASEGALFLAAQLAMPANPAERSQASRAGIRASSA